MCGQHIPSGVAPSGSLNAIDLQYLNLQSAPAYKLRRKLSMSCFEASLRLLKLATTLLASEGTVPVEPRQSVVASVEAPAVAAVSARPQPPKPLACNWIACIRSLVRPSWRKNTRC